MKDGSKRWGPGSPEVPLPCEKGCWVVDDVVRLAVCPGGQAGRYLPSSTITSQPERQKLCLWPDLAHHVFFRHDNLDTASINLLVRYGSPSLVVAPHRPNVRGCDRVMDTRKLRIPVLV